MEESAEKPAEQTAPTQASQKRRSPLRRAWRVTWIALTSLLLLVVALVGSLYIPGVLNAVAGWVLPSVEESTGMHIEVGDLRLRFPLRLSVSDALVTTPTVEGDTMLTLHRADATVRLLPLMRGRVKVSELTAESGMYQMGGRDSLYVRAELDTVAIGPVVAPFDFSKIDIDDARLHGANVTLVMGDSTSTTPPDTTATTPMLLTLRHASLEDVRFSMLMSNGAGATDTIGAAIDTYTLHDGQLLVADTIDLRARAMALRASSAIYGLQGAVPEPGLDMNSLQMSEIEIDLDSLQMHGSAMTVPLRRLHCRERSGLKLDASGTVVMDSTQVEARNFKLLTTYSTIHGDALMGLDSIAERCPVELNLWADVATEDVALAMPSLSVPLKALPRQVPLRLRAKLHGTLADLQIDSLGASMQRVFSLFGTGYVRDYTDPQKMVANVDMTGSIANSAPLDPYVKELGVKIPPLTLKAKASALRGNYAADIRGTTGSGRLALNGKYGGRAPNYEASVDLDSFPINAFMPDLGLGAVTASLRADGSGLDYRSPSTKVNLSMLLRRLNLAGRDPLTDISVDADYAQNRLNAQLHSGVDAADLDATLSAMLTRRETTWDLDASVRTLDLNLLALTDSMMNGSFDIASSGRIVGNADTIVATAAVRNLNWIQNGSLLMAPELTVDFTADPSQTDATLTNSDLQMHFNSPTPLNPLIDRFSRGADMLMSYLDKRMMLADTLQRELPQFTLDLTAGTNNLVSSFAAQQALKFQSLTMSLANDSVIHGDARLLNTFYGADIAIDTLKMDIGQRGDAITLHAYMDNRPGTFDEFAHVSLKGGMARNKALFYIEQRNIQDEIGYKLGVNFTVNDPEITVSFTPLDPIIAYKKWTFNEGNFVTVNPKTLHIDANLDADGEMGSCIEILSNHHHEHHTDGDEETEEHIEHTEAGNALAIKVHNFIIEDWLQLNPFSPDITGVISADVNLNYTDNDVSGNGTVNLRDITYGKERVGDFDLGLDLATNRSGVVNADVSLMVNGVKTITATGALNDSTKASPFLLDFSMIRLPLQVINPFLPQGMAKLSGMLNGKMEISGTITEPIFNGYINFDSAAVEVQMIGSSFRMSEEKVPVDSNLIHFNNYTIHGSNENPLYINGLVDMRRIAEPAIDLTMKARNMQVVNSKKRKGVDVYGKAFIDLDASYKAQGNITRINADLNVLPQTDVYYIVGTTTSEIGLQNTGDVVRFVNFSDTSAVAQADTIYDDSYITLITATLNVMQGSTVTVDLSSDGKNRAQIQGDGILNYSMSPSTPDGRLTGRFTINNGFARYSLPIVSEKKFDFTPGSYVAFNGELLNPQLNIEAVDEVKANVTREGENSRMVNFDVSVNVGGTLENMSVDFDMSTDDDATVQNELLSMSAEQRANQAMNLLLYGVYSGSSSSATANLSGNALYSFLTSQINSWAANSIKGVDLSFGMDQYSSTRDGQTSTATSYSYKVSKSLFNNRFKIVVGGNYSTDASSDENFSQNLVSDVSFEYLLNDAGSMYVRLFRHTGYESVLEGEITQTGAGFVLKRKLRTLSDIFRFNNSTGR
jgi:hypothetical protein